VIVSANAEGAPFPKAEASFTAKYDSAAAALNGLCWYDPEYGDKWTSRGSWTKEDWFQIDFGKPETVGAMRLFLYADEKGVQAPLSYTVLYDFDGQWTPVRPNPFAPRSHKPIAPILSPSLRLPRAGCELSLSIAPEAA
jgi:hypothetical protein